MNKRVLVLVIAIMVLIVATTATLVVMRQNDVTEAAPRPSATHSAAPGEGSYVEYSDTAIAEAMGTVVLFFHAPWCPQCRAIESDILADGVPAGYTVIKVDYDSNQDLREQYGVTLQTTFVEVSAQGTVVQSYVAYEDPRFQAVVDAMFW